MSNNVVPEVYKAIISDVVEKIRTNFPVLGVGDNVLAELQQTWLQKVAAARVADFPKELLDNGYTYEGGEGSENEADADNYDGVNEDGDDVPAVKLENVMIPQNDGTTDDLQNQRENVSANEDKPISLAKWAKLMRRRQRQKAIARTGRIAQLDGIDDDDDDDDEDDNEDGIIGSDLDDDDSEDENTEAVHLILCQYEKVNRIKNKWKCTLKDGIINVNGQDFLFNKAQGDFEW